jgi:hypothetical protein
MAQQALKSEPTRTAWRRQGAAPRQHTRRREAARVVVAWSSPLGVEAGRVLAPVHLELDTSSSGTAGGSWRCRELSGASWVDAIAAAGCTEVVLIAHLGRDGRGQHLVLELAETLARKLSGTKSHIRVHFMSSPTEASTPSARSA